MADSAFNRISNFNRLVKRTAAHTNTQKGSKRAGQKFVRTKDAAGNSIHLYASGQRVASPGASAALKVKKSSPAVRYGGTKVNNVAGNPRQGSSYRAGRDTAGNRYHRYAAEAGGIPQETYKITPQTKATTGRRPRKTRRIDTLPAQRAGGWKL